MNKRQVMAILEKKLDELEVSALRGKERTGAITGTLIVAGCSPGKITCTFPKTSRYRFVEKMLLNRGHAKGRHDGKKIGGTRVRQLSKIVDVFLENEFYEKTYGVRKKVGEMR